jgi:small redox-active disulfide protein 2
MTTIKVLGTGCPKCQQTTALVQQVVDDNGIEAKVIKVEDIMEIIEYNILSTPALVINEDIKISGRVPTKTEIEQLLL